MRQLGRPDGPSTRRAPRFATFVDRDQLPAPPLALNVGHGLPDQLRAYGNDYYGDCTCATWATIFLVDAHAQGQAIDFAEQDVLAMYEASGFKLDDKTTDRGWSMSAAADYAQWIGIVDDHNKVRRAGPWLQINRTDITEIQIALFLCGALPVGVDLPIAAQKGGVWDTDGGGGDQEPGGWGGHSLTLVGYDHDGVTFRTWGDEQRATWRWWARYVDEVIAKIDPLWCSGDKPTAAGFRIDELTAALGAMR